MFDFGRSGDETALVVLEQGAFSKGTDGLFVVYIETMQLPLNEVIGRVCNLHSLFNFRQIICDQTGMGEGPVAVLKERLGHIVEGVIFTSKSKPEIFFNLKLLLEQKKLKIPSHLYSRDERVKKLFYQLLSIEQEFSERSEVPRIKHAQGTHDDIVAALALAAFYFKVGRRHRGYFVSK